MVFKFFKRRSLKEPNMAMGQHMKQRKQKITQKGTEQHNTWRSKIREIVETRL